jgi:hypothetical protein
MAVTKTAQANKGILWNGIPGARIFKMVVMKLMAPSIDEIPARCRLKIARSTDPPEWLWTPANGGYQEFVRKPRLYLL